MEEERQDQRSALNLAFDCELREQLGTHQKLSKKYKVSVHYHDHEIRITYLNLKAKKEKVYHVNRLESANDPHIARKSGTIVLTFALVTKAAGVRPVSNPYLFQEGGASSSAASLSRSELLYFSDVPEDKRGIAREFHEVMGGFASKNAVKKQYQARKDYGPSAMGTTMKSRLPSALGAPRPRLSLMRVKTKDGAHVVPSSSMKNHSANKFYNIPPGNKNHAVQGMKRSKSIEDERKPPAKKPKATEENAEEKEEEAASSESSDVDMEIELIAKKLKSKDGRPKMVEQRIPESKMHSHEEGEAAEEIEESEDEQTVQPATVKLGSRRIMAPTSPLSPAVAGSKKAGLRSEIDEIDLFAEVLVPKPNIAPTDARPPVSLSETVSGYINNHGKVQPSVPDVSESPKLLGPRMNIGIPNLGNTCFAAASIQALCALPYFASDLEKQERLHPTPLLEELGDLCDMRAQVLRKVSGLNGGSTAFDSSERLYLRGNKIIEAVSKKHTQFAMANVQHDAQEWLLALLEMIQPIDVRVSMLSSLKAQSNECHISDAFLVDQRFASITRSKACCTKCGRETLHPLEVHRGLSVQLVRESHTKNMSVKRVVAPNIDNTNNEMNDQVSECRLACTAAVLNGGGILGAGVDAEIRPGSVASQSKSKPPPLESAPILRDLPRSEPDSAMKSNLSYFLAQQYQAEEIDMSCESCRTTEPMLLSTKFLLLPQYLCLHLKRFRPNQDGSGASSCEFRYDKMDAPVSTPLEIRVDDLGGQFVKNAMYLDQVVDTDRGGLEGLVEKVVRENGDGNEEQGEGETIRSNRRISYLSLLKDPLNSVCGVGSGAELASHGTTSIMQDTHEGHAPQRVYKLCSVIEHVGTKASSGHYISITRDADSGIWYQWDDATCRKIRDIGCYLASDAHKKGSYVYFYSL